MLEVTAAIMMKNDKVLIARRATGSHAGGWEFPGGKVEQGETPADCLARELFEELGVSAEVGDFFAENEHEYNNVCLKLLAYFVNTFSGDFELRVHDKLEWVALSDLLKYKLLAADVPIAEKLIASFI